MAEQTGAKMESKQYHLSKEAKLDPQAERRADMEDVDKIEVTTNPEDVDRLMERALEMVKNIEETEKLLITYATERLRMKEIEDSKNNRDWMDLDDAFLDKLNNLGMKRSELQQNLQMMRAQLGHLDNALAWSGIECAGKNPELRSKIIEFRQTENWFPIYQEDPQELLEAEGYELKEKLEADQGEEITQQNYHIRLPRYKPGDQTPPTMAKKRNFPQSNPSGRTLDEIISNYL